MLTDFSDIAALQSAIYGCCDTLEKMRDEYAAARQVVEFSSERSKSALAGQQAIELESGKGVGAAEVYARQSDGYRQAMAAIAKQYEAAQSVIAKWHIQQSKLDALRSILSTQRNLIKEL